MGLRYFSVCGFELLVIVAHFLFMGFLYLTVASPFCACSRLHVHYMYRVVQYSWSMVAAHEMSRTYLMCCGSKVGWAVVEATARLG